MNKNIFLTVGLFALLVISYLMFTDTEKSEKPSVALNKNIPNQIEDNNKHITYKVPIAEESKASEEKASIKKPEQAPISALSEKSNKTTTKVLVTEENKASKEKAIIKKPEQAPISVLSEKSNKTTTKVSSANAEKLSLNHKHAGMNLPENIDPPPGSRAAIEAGIAPPLPQSQSIQKSKPRATDPNDTSLPPYEENDIPADRVK